MTKLPMSAELAAAYEAVADRNHNRAYTNKDGTGLWNQQAQRHQQERYGRQVEAGQAPPSVVGEQHHNAKLTDDAVRVIRSAFLNGRATYRGLAEQYGVSHVTILQVVHGRTWKHVA